MGKNKRHAYLKEIRSRYRRSGRQAKSRILDEFCAVCGYHRKYAIRLLHQPVKRARRRIVRPPVYGSKELLTALKRIWFATDQMCSKRLVAVLALWLPFYRDAYEPLSPETEQQLRTLSAATIDRLLKAHRVRAGKGRCTTKPGTLLKNQIPIRTDHWDVTEPGFVEADTVAHCGNSLAGDFIWSLTLTDINSGWTENRATWNHGAQGVVTQIRDIEARLPFALQGFDCDNGSEFLNYHLLRYFTKQRDKPVPFTRSRPYHKIDNAHVEQKNWSHVRQLFGYDRLERRELLSLMNALYANHWSAYQNHFCPTLKLLEKTRINSKYRKRYEPPKTPYHRLLQSEHISTEAKEQLRTVHQSLNPFEIKRAIERKLRAIFKLVKVTTNVRQRL